MKQLSPIAYVLLSLIIATVAGTTLFLLMHHILLLSMDSTTFRNDQEASLWILVLTTLLLTGSCWLFAKLYAIRFQSYTKGKNLRLLLTRTAGLIVTGILLSEHQCAQQFHLHQTPLLHMPAGTGLHMLFVALYVTTCALAIVVFQSNIDKALHSLFIHTGEPDFLQCFNEKIKAAAPGAKEKYQAAKKVLFEFADGKAVLPFHEIDAPFRARMEEWLRTRKKFADVRTDSYFGCYHSVFNHGLDKHKIKAVSPFEGKQLRSSSHGL